MRLDEFNQLDFAGIAKRSVDKLQAKYPVADAESYVQDALLKLTIRFDDVDSKTAEGWVYTVAQNLLMRRDGQYREKPGLPPGDEPPLPGVDPVQLGVLRARRERQSRALSDTLRTFVSECEAKPPRVKKGKPPEWVGLRWKECFERHFFGQSDDEIEEVMRQYADMKDAKNSIQTDRSRAWDRIEEIKQTHDVRRTLFTADPARHRSSPIQVAPPAQQPITVASHDHRENPLPSDDAARDNELLADRLPDATSSKILYIWLIRDTPAFCPSPVRFAEFVKQYAKLRQPTRADCPTEFLDVWFHAVERQCRVCAAVVATGSPA